MSEMEEENQTADLNLVARRDIERSIGIEPHRGEDNYSEAAKAQIQAADPAVRMRLIAWCVTWGVPRQGKESAGAASSMKLWKAYASPGYIQGWARGIGTGKAGGRFPTRPEPFTDDSEGFDFFASAKAAQVQAETRQEIHKTLTKELVEPPSTVSYTSFDQARDKMVQVVSSTIEDRFKALRDEIHKDLLIRETNIKGALQLSLNQLGADLAIQVKQDIAKTIQEGGIELKLGPKISEDIKAAVKQAADEFIWQAATPAMLSQANPEPELEVEVDQTGYGAYIPKLDPLFYFDPFPTKVARSCITLAKNAYFVGDKGCGKSMLIEQVHAKLGKGVIRFNFSGDTTKTDLLGGIRVVEGATVYHYGPLPTAMKLGLTLQADEIDYCPPHIMAVMNSVAEKGGKLFLPDTGEIIKPAHGFCIMATANTGGKGDTRGVYTGTEVLNSAALDRYAAMVKCKYLPEAEEKAMLKRRFPITTSGITVSLGEIDNLWHLADLVRQAFARSELGETFSTRKLIDFLDWRTNGFDEWQSLELTLLNHLDDDDMGVVMQFTDRIGWPMLPKEA